MVLFLKEHRQVALHVACGDITDVQIDANNLIINANDGMLINLLNDGKREIENALRWQGLELNVEISIKKENITKEDEDIKKLKETFGDYLTIKGGKYNGLW